MGTEDKPKCVTCGRSHPFQDGTMPRHPFNDGSLPGSATFGDKTIGGTRVAPNAHEDSVQVIASEWPFDPVLRMALIEKGVLVPEDLVRAEATIRAATNQFANTGGVTP